MKEFRSIVNEYNKIDFSVRKAALATVVKVRGSSYRSPGARMLITDDGRWVGSISGGCLEGDALRKARKVMDTKVPMTITYDTREESNQYLGIGLGCNGVIDVLIQPLESGHSHQVEMFRGFLETTKPLAMATVFEGPESWIGKHLLLNHEGIVQQDQLSAPGINSMIRNDLLTVLETGKSEARMYQTPEHRFEAFVEMIQPSISVVIFGGGFDARPVSELAKSLGWNVTVTDECVAHIAPAFFPNADKLSLCQREWIEREIPVNEYTACVLMSHNYEYDRDVLKKLLKSEVPYIGILGPKKRYDKMLDEFRREGIELTPEDNHRIHSPIGVDIGAETPDEIALSIVAEIQAKFAGRNGGFLKYRSRPIHERDKTGDQVFKQVFLQGGTSVRSING